MCLKHGSYGITISKDLLKKAREKEINISSFVDIELRRYLALIE
ncbi:type II toxin-antitoxin system CcdA family antitoxin, partial [bacterium]|nr:type II toxin-antitoxin system CcdA family antitoxin [bacterium]